MISTVTTATVTGVSSLTLVVVLLLLGLLIQKEIVSNVEAVWAQRLSRALDVVLAPALFSFVFILIAKVMDVLG